MKLTAIQGMTKQTGAVARKQKPSLTGSNRIHNMCAAESLQCSNIV